MKKVSAQDNFLVGLFVIIAVIVCSPAASWALYADYIDFNMDATHDGASISYAGGANPLIGTNISVDKVGGYQGNPPNGVLISGSEYNIDGGLLSFTSGNFINRVADVWTFGKGTIAMTGGITSAVPGGPNIASGSTLLRGEYDTMVVQKVGDQFSFYFVWTTFNDRKHVELGRYYFGITGDREYTYNGGLMLTFNAAPGDEENSFSSTSVYSGDLINARNPVPLPGAVWLLGAGLVGLVGVRRRMLKKDK